MRRDVFRKLINAQGTQLEVVKYTSLGRLVTLKSVGTLPEDSACWANAQHSTSSGFELIASRVYAPKLKQF